jgi:hypothetical protein
MEKIISKEVLNGTEKFIIVYSPTSFLKSEALLTFLKAHPKIMVPFQEFKGKSKSFYETFDSYFYILEKDLTSLIKVLKFKFLKTNFEVLGKISGKEILKLKASFNESLNTCFEVGGHYRLITGEFKNLIVKLVEVNQEDTICHYSLLGKDYFLNVELSALDKVPERDLAPKQKKHEFMDYLERSKKMGERKAIVIDGSYVLHRSMHKHSNLYVRRTKKFIGGFYGFYFNLLKIKELFV